MLQQIIALTIIAIFITRLVSQRKKQNIGRNEFLFWLFFWLAGPLAIIFIKRIDFLLSNLGFSGSGINFLFYLTVIILFYLVFKLRLTIAKMESNITKISRKISLDKSDEKSKYNREQNNKEKEIKIA